MVKGDNFFIIHAPRQSGKTTFLKALIKKINSEGQMYAPYCSLEVIQGLTGIDRAMSTARSQIIAAIKL
jgi:molybdopterin-guanine dinucleotide biosynthesis protein